MSVQENTKKPKERAVSKKTKMSWEGWDALDGREFHKKRRAAFNYYYDEHKPSDLLPFLYDWMKNNGYDKTAVDLAKSRGSIGLTTAGILARCLSDGMPDFNSAHNDYWNSLDGTSGDLVPVTVHLRKFVDAAIQKGSIVVEEEPETSKNTGPILTIQDRMKEVAATMSEEIDLAIDRFQQDPEKFDAKAIKIVNLLKGKDAKAAHARVIKGFYSDQLRELQEAAAGTCEQLKEAYGHLSKKELKKIIEFYQEIVSACDMLAQEAKVSRKPKAKKPKPKEKLVEKLNFAKTDEKLKLVSIDPVKIIGAKELWVYNVKTRKLGKYIADAYSELSVKGTTVVGFDEISSIQKTLRKPEEQLQEFKNAGKVQLRKFLDDIKAVDIKLNGRINAETILLKVG